MTLPKPHIATDSFFDRTPFCSGTGTGSSSPSASSPWPITIYFISGNPGLISYYHVFLSLLSKKLASSQLAGHSGLHIVGHSLAGFELETETVQNEDGKQIYDLEEQICFVQRRLEGHMRGLRADPTASSHRNDLVSHAATEVERPRPKVILIGHSVGTYIAMEILRRHRERQSTTSVDVDADANFEITGGIMLFPTVLDIAKSPSGRKLTLLLRIIPQLALVVSLFARLLTTILPDGLLRGLVRSIMQSPPECAVDATTRFLRSRWGVREALHMAADEMRTITSDKWSEDVWGVPRAADGEVQSESKSLTQLFFYFGRNDHWVAEKTREEILAARGGMQAGRGPRMVVCEESVPHAFCLRHNEIMASKVADMVQEILVRGRPTHLQESTIDSEAL